jgi:hypothetical protein
VEFDFAEDLMKKSVLFLGLMTLFVTAAAAADARIAIEGIFPDSGPPGTTVIIKGRGFALGDANRVWAENMKNVSAPGFVEFNGARARLMLWQDNMAVVIVPDHANSGPVRLTLSSGISIQGNHFELTDADGVSPDAAGRKDYSFLESESAGFYPSPYYYYYGYNPRVLDGRYTPPYWSYNGDGCLDFFLVSGPILSTCGLNTGLDNVMFFPRRFMGDFRTRHNWWQNAVPYYDQVGKQKKSYSFQQ